MLLFDELNLKECIKFMILLGGKFRGSLSNCSQNGFLSINLWLFANWLPFKEQLIRFENRGPALLEKQACLAIINENNGMWSSMFVKNYLLLPKLFLSFFPHLLDW